MRITELPLAEISVNINNPRDITAEKMQLLVESVLTLPKMLRIRTIVIDEDNNILGGNMRYKALKIIAAMTEEKLRETLSGNTEFSRMTEAEKEYIVGYWISWQANPTIPVTVADMSEDEMRHFLIADNGSFGKWNYDMLANEWDEEMLVSWGCDVWMPESEMESESEDDKAEETQTDKASVTITYTKDMEPMVASLLGVVTLKKNYDINELIS